jgi:hypothetical protein
MGSYDVPKQLESYSNAILGFIVLQGLAFSFYFGTSLDFKKAIQTFWSLSAILLILFAAVLVGSLYVNGRISAALQKGIRANDKRLVRKIFQGKAVIIVLFGSMPILFVALYGLIKLNF